MPSQKRSFPFSLDDGDTFSHLSNHHLQQQQQQPMQHKDEDEENEEVDEELEEAEEQGDAEEEEQDDEDEEEGQHQNNNNDEKPHDSDETPSSESDDKSEFIYIELQEVRKDVQCPICLGIIKKTRTVMECLHRFCRECIDKSMRLGNNECPACRTHCASRRSLRDDLNYDALIASLYPDIEKYEEEELEFREEDKSRNKQLFSQIQASIAKVVQRQSESAGKRRKDTPGASVPRSQCNQRNVHSRRQNQVIDIQGSDDNAEENDNNEKNSSSDDEQCTEARQRKRKRRTRVRPSQPSSSRASPDGGCIESDMDISREYQGTSRQVTIPHKLTWGRGGLRSHTRYGSGGGSNSRSSRCGRLSKLVDHLRNLDENTDEFEIHLMLVSLDKQSTPILKQPHLCCQPTLSVKHLCEYVACQTPLAVEEVEIFAVKGLGSTKCEKSADDTSALICDELTAIRIDPSNDELEILQEHESLAGITSKCISKMEHLILAYRRKEAL
ncbi:PREDICTED: putative E3 ubiquitin-protein ligase RING1a isoform X2 [Lupinus angustifolius]|uniref:putative E3 ubiquitin-protein ligase RING1a isoform X2 n=1 Tax=Lupinus angustifolius TaxID=3871 RepID=UPI00092FCB8D|nr:PREDICTED: putative E3 ubiquitin-protein ligase RING1a isoform X2 [Lupinus angustifolius]